MKKLITTLCIITSLFAFIGCEKAPDVDAPSSTDLFSYEVVINNKLYTFPGSVSKFTKNGWNLRDIDKETKLQAGKMEKLDLTDGDKELSVYIRNTDKKDKPKEDCEVSGILIGIHANNTLPEYKIVFPGNITMDSSKEEIVKAYGKPSETLEKDKIDTLIYWDDKDNLTGAQFYIDKETGKLTDIELKN